MANFPTRSDRGSALPARWDPFRELEDVRARMDRLFSDVLGGAGAPAGAVWVPPVDLEERDDVDAGNIDAQLDDGVLTVRVPKPARAQPRRIEVKGR